MYPMKKEEKEKDLVKQQFTRQAGAYTKGLFSDLKLLKKIVELSGVTQKDRVLDVACGGGFLALEFAKTAESVIGIDITPKMIESAELLKTGAGITNIKFRILDAGDIPYQIDSFDIVVCRFAFHHFPAPEKVLDEMARVSKRDVMLIDGISPEDDEQSRYLNEIEKIRDKSHVRLYKKSELKTMMKNAGLNPVKMTHLPVDQYLDEWIDRADPPEADRKVVEEMMSRGLKDDLCGLDVRFENGRIKFTYDTLTILARKGSSLQKV